MSDNATRHGIYTVSCVVQTMNSAFLSPQGQRRVQVMSAAHVWPQESPSQVNWREKCCCWSRCLTNLKITPGMVRAPGKGVNWSQRPEMAAQSLLSTQDKTENVAPSSRYLLLSPHPLPRDLLLARQRPVHSSIQCNCRAHISCPGSLQLTFGLRSEFEDNGLAMG